MEQPNPWWELEARKCERQIRLLQKLDYNVHAYKTRAIARFMIGKPSWSGGFVTIVITWDFPNSLPFIEVILFDEHGRLVKQDASHLWKPELSFVHIILRAEKEVFSDGTP